MSSGAIQKIHFRASITENNAILLASKTLERGGSIMIDASIKPPTESIYVSPKKSDSVNVETYAKTQDSKVKMINPHKAVEIYRDYLGFRGEFYGLYEQKVDFSHISKDKEGKDKGKISALLLLCKRCLH